MFGRQFPYRFVVAAVFVSALFLDIVDSTVVNVAIPSIGRDLRTEAVEWVVIGYTLSLAVFIPASGWLGDRFGTKRVFMAALVIFIGCSALCGAARNLEQLVVFRILRSARVPGPVGRTCGCWVSGCWVRSPSCAWCGSRLAGRHRCWRCACSGSGCSAPRTS